MKAIPAAALLIASVIAAEVSSALWMSPRPPDTEALVLDFKYPIGESQWTFRSELYDEVEPSLRCSAGWIFDRSDESGSDYQTRIAFFKWDSAQTVNTLEAFKHLPEQCMGHIGMRLEKIHPARLIATEQGTLSFDSTQFRPEGGGASVHVFKCVWVSGFDGSNLREDILMGSTGLSLRRLRFAAAVSRFRPPHARIIMGAVPAMPTEELAWNHFRELLTPQLEWLPADPHG
jgi:hypothetical protein